MFGTIFGFAGLATTRLALFAFSIGLWLLTRPGGWAVLAVLALVGVKLIPQTSP
ncbi:hypothetical protein [Pseudothioclava nitratireducens]|jgi:hypothetical protein|uniref:hypothetical protein n=1 Tax=Pseudothioclava nitratireducens TaxID=1928646 RepID=UPI0023DB7CF0|nr:hypothetical protein [Defluviimonas nitratireducens]MDF1620295.1 hypothetical protein [Defluviimonas nitratireducens]